MALTPQNTVRCHANIKGIGNNDGDGLGDLDSLSALVRQHSAQKHEEIRALPVSDQSSHLRIKKIMELFYQLIELPEKPNSQNGYYFIGLNGNEWFYNKKKIVLDGLRDILTPSEIDIVLHLMLYEADEGQLGELYKLGGMVTVMQSFGSFISKLISFSYSAGHNGFTLTTNHPLTIEDIANELYGKEDKYVKIKITSVYYSKWRR